MSAPAEPTMTADDIRSWQRVAKAAQVEHRFAVTTNANTLAALCTLALAGIEDARRLAGMEERAQVLTNMALRVRSGGQDAVADACSLHAIAAFLRAATPSAWGDDAR